MMGVDETGGDVQVVQEEKRPGTLPEIFFQVWQEKKEDRGEDAYPILILETMGGYTGVFDGMGGAGATMFEWRGNTRSGAYIAGNIVRETCLHYMLSNDGLVIEELKTIIREKLQAENSKHGQQRTSRLKSNMLKNFPTTLAITRYQLNTGNTVDIQSFWAGDSRNYMLTPDRGLVQLTKDDLKGDLDPYENLSNDAPMANYINEKGFVINERPVSRQSLPVVLLSATDGCFGYYPTPMHFEYLLLRTLVDARDKKEWGELVKRELNNISGDDFSMSLVVIGRNINFSNLKNKFWERLNVLSCCYMDSLNRVRDCKKQEKILWDEYKQEYLNDSQHEKRGNYTWLHDIKRLRGHRGNE